MVDIPGYRFDAATNRYYKLTQPELRRQAAQQERKAKRKKQTKPDVEARDQHGQLTAARKVADCAKSKVSIHAQCDDIAGSLAFKVDIGRRRLLHRGFLSDCAAYRQATTRAPDLFVGDTISRFAIDLDAPEQRQLRYGTSSGLIAHGYLTEPAGSAFNVEAWQSDFMLGSNVTSLHVRSGIILTTTFGPAAQVVFAYTDLSETAGGVSIQPRKTSIWSSSLGSNTRHVAIGCDKKVIYFAAPFSDEGRNLNTGSTVFALQHSANDHTLVAGTRSGQIRLYDLRQARTNAENITHRPDLMLRLKTSVTNLKLYREHYATVSLINGDIEIFDIRFPSLSGSLSKRSVLSLYGHVNTLSSNLGFDIDSNGRILAAAGEDGKVRLWSLSDGVQVNASHEISRAKQSSARLRDTVFDTPPPAIVFSPSANGTVDDLWVADGPVVHKYAVTL